MSDRTGRWQARAIELAESFYMIGAAGVVLAKPLVQAVARWIRDRLRRTWSWWQSLDGGGRRRTLGAIAAVLALLYAWSWRDVPCHWLAYIGGERPLYAAKTWHYQLDKASVDELAKNTTDVLVIDYATSGGKVPLTPDEVARLKVRADGSRRFVISYMSIGEAEQYRFYFRPEWKDDPPEWLGDENCAWPGAHKVRFWHDSWKDIVWRGRKSYLKQIVDAGFDGVYLDRVDIYDMFPERATARSEMIEFVSDLSATAKRLKPGFLVLPQNADDLLQERGYRAVIDGLGREDLLYGAHQTGKRNPAREIRTAQARLERLLWEWKPVLAVEYLQTRSEIAKTGEELASRGMVATFQPRALDGTDPTAPIDLSRDIGTAEYTRANCPKGKAW